MHPARGADSVEMLLKHADPRIFNMHHADRMALGDAMPHLRDHIDYYASRRRDARLAPPAAAQAVRASLVDPRGMIATTAAMYRRIVKSVRAIGTLAARKTRDPKNRGLFFDQEVEAFINSFARRQVGGIAWIQRYAGDRTWAFFPDDGHMGGHAENLPLPRGMSPALVHHMTIPSKKLWTIRVDVKPDAVTLSVHIGGDPTLEPNNARWIREHEREDPYWDAIVTTRIASDGSVTLRHAKVSACHALHLEPNRKASADSCTKAMFAGVRLFGPEYRIVFAGSLPKLSWNMKGLRNAVMR